MATVAQQAGPPGPRDAGLFLLGALPPALLYFLSAPRTITLDDAGLFAMLCDAGAVMHPPGYPAYALLCGAAAQLPLASVHQSLVLLSAALAAATCGLLALVARTLGAGTVGALVAAWLLACAVGFWEQATIPEVYSYNTLLTAALALLILRTDGTAPARAMGGLGLLAGLGLSGHWPLFLASGPALLLLVLSRDGLLTRLLSDGRSLGAALAACLVGLLPYAWLCWRLLHPPETTFTDVSGLDDLLAYLRRDFYAEVDVVTGVTPGDRLAFFAWLPRLAFEQFGPWLLLSPLGLWVLRGRPWICAALPTLVLCHTVVLLALLSWPFEYRRQSLFEAYPLMAWFGLALLIGVAVGALLERLRALAGVSRQALRLAGAGALLLAVAVPVLRDGGDSFRAGDDRIDAAGRALLEGLPEGALLVVDSDPMTTVLGYLHFVEGVRPDLRLRHYLVLVFPERLYDWGPPSVRRRAVDAALARGDVYFTGRLEHSGHASTYGALQRASREPPDGPCPLPVGHARAALTLIDGPTLGAPERQFRDLVLRHVTTCTLELAPTAPAALKLLTALQEVPIAARLSMSHLLASDPSPERDLELHRLAEILRARPEIHPSREIAGVTLLLTGLAAQLDAPGFPADPARARRELEEARRLLGADDARVIAAFERLDTQDDGPGPATAR